MDLGKIPSLLTSRKTVITGAAAYIAYGLDIPNIHIAYIVGSLAAVWQICITLEDITSKEKGK